ncbi:hypothetical protein HL666_05160 [Bradyrhizobium sp. 83002]|uniref:hypothetical protein n=1 Tax=Bradyrhizobium aeschynomenes TaxID=2734909 RepID=UPI0015568192|nr:hypothetical protein [Bradyrhizobium aeschynomenes]NPU10140.1 hypothetical protein [Bradyrhizobium aeschynomenes]NPV19454.1 hypothetical protein [Bradyrhizobium aeschynomenes]
MKTIQWLTLTFATTMAASGVAGALSPANAAAPPPAKNCPAFGWSEGLGQYLKPDAAFPTSDTKTIPTPDCNFHQWSWEAFVWATALVKDSGSGSNVPRFMTLATPAELLSNADDAGAPKLRPLTLAARAQVFHGAAGFTEGAGAIVQADGNMLVAQNGYPVYASVHMNQTYFNTARKNLIVTGGYQSQPASSSFAVGDAVFKATWLRLDPNQAPPAGAYTTQAQVPVLENKITPGQITIQPVAGKFVTVTVALIGLHVVGYTENHPEFLWGTFELKNNSPQTPDNTFEPSASRSDPKSYTLYKGRTPFSQVNIAAQPGASRPQLTLDPATQKLTPVTNVVLENKTGGENQPNGVGNIYAINAQAQGFLSNLKGPQSTFASYSLDGTVWMLPNSYNLNSNQTNAVGSVNLANATAETFVQQADNTPIKNVLNCFLCHNPTSYSFQTPPPAKLPNRLIALSHVLSIGSPYEVPNSISGKLLMRPDPFRK